MTTFAHESSLPVSAAEAYAWHARPGAFGRLMPAWQRATILRRASELADGTEVEFELAKGPLRLRWLAEHRNVRRGELFEDEQRRGPFRSWRHRHEFLPEGRGASRLRDRVDYELPLSPVADWLAGAAIRRDLERTFAYRHRVLGQDLEMHRRWADDPRLRVAVSGASGLIGRALCDVLTTGGHEVIRLSRRPDGPSESTGAAVGWGPERGLDAPEALEGVDAVVHLAGENIAARRWTRSQRERIRSSRVEGTLRLIASLETLRSKPRIFVCASAIGIYGDRGEEVLDEASRPGDGFLAEVCTEWEAAAARAGHGLGARVATARFGVVLSPRGGALAKMLPAFRLGLGGRFGDGRHGVSWVAIDDAVAALVHLLMEPSLSGPFNVTAPTAVANAELARSLGAVLGRPAFAALPAPAARLLFGRMAEEMLLASTWVRPARLLETGFTFRFPRLGSALRHLLGR